ncbi:MAG: hypothetical protein A3I07_04290 [Candidatus Doudnabacteria bacterium RIFCSPLOWO2_02_FULL_42_9]|nr:MAG: hypothetical protein A3I07_04290 [Candidatus Doudnabacteria bacterium RIFCSPLOWO2_02_FULL_42_9]
MEHFVSNGGNKVAAQDKVVMAFPGAQSELDRILEVILKELEAGEQQLQGTGLLYQLFAVWLTFFRHLKEHRSTVEIRRGLDDVGLTYLEYASNLGVQPLNYPTLEQLIAFAQQLQNAEQRLESLADLEARAFGAETALSQRIIENGELREQLDEKRTLEAELGTRIMAAIPQITEIGAKELDYLTRLMDSIKGLQSQLARSILQLADSTAQLKPEPLDTEPVSVLKEIERRNEWLSRLRAELLQVDHQLELLEEQNALGTERPAELEKFRQLHEALRKMETVAKSDKDRLTRYLRAIETLQAGLSDGLMGGHLPKIPTLDDLTELEKEVVKNTGIGKGEQPSAKVIEGRAVEEGEPVEKPKPVPTVAIGSGQRYIKIATIAAKHGISAETLLLITLFEVVQAKNHRGIAKFFATARAIGLFGVFGYEPNVRRVSEAWNKAQNLGDTSRYLQYFGVMGSSPTFMRTELPIEWSVRDVLTEDELEAFLQTYSEKRIT